MANTFSRKSGIYKPQPRVLVLCEDTKSCKTYLQDAADYFRSYVLVDHCGKNDPLGIVTEALNRRRTFDHVYCAVDRDTHETFDAAVRLAAKHPAAVTLMTSYPCYEFWLYLHFKYSRKPYAVQGARTAGDCIVKDLCLLAEMADYDKGNAKGLFDKLLPKLPVARVHAQRAFEAAKNEFEPNPSTRLHDLIGEFEKLGKPTPAV